LTIKMPQITKVSLFIAYALQLGYFLGANKAFAQSTTLSTVKPSKRKPIPEEIGGIPMSKSKPGVVIATKATIMIVKRATPKVMIA